MDGISIQGKICRGTISPNDDNLITDSFNTNVRNQ